MSGVVSVAKSFVQPFDQARARYQFGTGWGNVELGCQQGDHLAFPGGETLLLHLRTGDILSRLICLCKVVDPGGVSVKSSTG
jgi:hypothetical protein